MHRSLYRVLWWQAFLASFSRERDQHIAFSEAEWALDALRLKFPELDSADPPLTALDEDLAARPAARPAPGAARPPAPAALSLEACDRKGITDWCEAFSWYLSHRECCAGESIAHAHSAARAALQKMPSHLYALEPAAAASRVCPQCLAWYFLRVKNARGFTASAVKFWHEDTLGGHGGEGFSGAPAAPAAQEVSRGIV